MRRFMLASLTVAVIGGLFLGSPGVDARRRPPPTAVTVDCGSSPGLTIDAPGRYRLTNSVLDCLANPVISITSPGVVLDLDGRRLDAGGANTGISISEPRVSVINGALKDFALHISTALGANGVFLRNLYVQDGGTGVNAAGTISVSGSTFTDQDVSGIIAAASATIRDTLVTSAADTGIIAGGSSTLVGNRVTDGSAGVVLNGDGNKVIGNTIASNTGNGIEAAGSGNVIRSNTLDANLADGILLNEDENTVSHNRIGWSGNDGIQIQVTGNHNRVFRNRIQSSFFNGVRDFGELNVYTSNLNTGNGGSGFNVANDDTFIRNTASGNNDYGILGGERLVISGNVANGNRLAGIQAIENITLTGNKASGNLGSGIVVTVPDADSSIRRNTANENGAFGITTGGVDVPHARNIATGNVQVAQCDPAQLCN